MKLSILVADNDEYNRTFYKRELETRGYHVELASSPEEVRYVFSTKTIHLILMDRRLTDDDPLDRSGEALASELAGPVPILIFTSFGLEDAFAATAKVIPGKIEYANKKDGFTAILTKIEQVIVDHVRLNLLLEFTGYKFAQMVGDLELEPSGATYDFYKGDIEALFRKVFRLRRKLTLTRLPIENHPYIMLHVLAELENGRIDSFLVVCGMRNDMLRAKTHYESLGLRHSNGMLLKNEFRLQYALLAFAGNGGTPESITTLREVCQLPHVDFPAVWETFAKTTLRVWYHPQSAMIKGEQVITTHCEYTGLDPDMVTPAAFNRLAQAICGTPLPGEYKISYANQQIAIRSNGSVLFELPAQIDLRRIAPVLETMVGVVNPSVRLDQILVDLHTHQSWLLNYATMAMEAPLLLPFATLELEVKQEMLAQAHTSFYERYQLEYLLVHAPSLDAIIEDEMLSPKLHQTLQAIQSIRRSAAELLHVEDIFQYNVSLLFAGLAVLSRFVYLHTFNAQKQQPFFAQVLIGTALAFNTLQPNELIREGLWIDRKQKKLWLDGRWIDLSTGEYDVVELLAQTPGQVCSYWSIICSLLQPSLKGMENKLRAEGVDREEIEEQQQAIIRSYKNTIDPRVYRIRTAINDSKKPFRYLINDRGNGFCLMLAGIIEE